MGGLLVLAPFAEYICGAARLFKRTTSYRAKALVVVVASLISPADAATKGV